MPVAVVGGAGSDGKTTVLELVSKYLVVNGDADLIYYLEMGEDGKTKFTPLTLEDINNRSKLISLEGGSEAFSKRENKYKKVK